jgi:hypothetical protein
MLLMMVGNVGPPLIALSLTFVISSGCLLPGAGAFEVAVHAALDEFKTSVKGRARLGVQVCLPFSV